LQSVEQRLCRLEVGSIEAFGEAPMDGREKIECLSASALVATQSGEA
jgi:hypothetical protein